MSSTEVFYLWHYQNLSDKAQFDELSRLLGVVWDLSKMTAESTDATVTTDNSKLFIPLTVAINPKILEFVRGKSKPTASVIGGGEFVPAAGEKVVPMSEMPKEQFLAMVGVRSAKPKADTSKAPEK